MLDPSQPLPLDLTDFNTYLAGCRALAQKRLAGLASMQEVDAAQARLNRYPRLERLSEASEVLVLEDLAQAGGALARAAQALLGGAVLLEHACAGEATRLGLGAKYLLNPAAEFSPEVMTRLLPAGRQAPLSPQSLRPLSLGRRHMLQLAWDLWRLAEEHGQDPAAVLKAQRLLIIVNENSAPAIERDFLEARFYGFAPERVLFMVQQAFAGLALADGHWAYDPASPRRLHNHGQMLLQTTMDHQLFCLDQSGRPRFLSWSEFQSLLSDMEDKVSFNIEDLDYLGQSLDLSGLAAALEAGARGASMVMEVVANDPDNPIKGGACFFDPGLERTVVIESFQLAGLALAELRLLNKNVNHYPRPARALAVARQRGLAMPLAVKERHLYFQPVQGDLNFLVPTTFLRRARLKPIRAWKSAVNTGEALLAMAAQDARPGFLAWAGDLTGLRL